MFSGRGIMDDPKWRKVFWEGRIYNNLENLLDNFSDPHCQVTVVLEDASLSVNRMYFILISKFMKELINIDVTKIVIPHMTRKNFDSLLQVVMKGKVSFESEEDQDSFLEDIQCLGFDPANFRNVFATQYPSFDMKEPTKSAEQVLGSMHKNIDRFEVKDKVITCQFCLQMLSSKQALKRHEEICDKNPSSIEKPNFKCDECKLSFKTEVGLKSHIEANHQSNQLHKCGSCSKEFKHLHNLKRHCKTQKHTFQTVKGQQIENNLDKTWCEICLKFVKSDNFEIHKLKHDSQEFQCDHCDFTCNRKDSLHRHMKLQHDVHNIDFTTIIENCTASLKYKEGDKVKVLSTPSKLTFTCNKCKEKFESEEEITEHMKLLNCKKL